MTSDSGDKDSCALTDSSSSCSQEQGAPERDSSVKPGVTGDRCHSCIIRPGAGNCRGNPSGFIIGKRSKTDFGIPSFKCVIVKEEPDILQYVPLS